MIPTNQGRSAEDWDASSPRDAYEAPTIIALGTLTELTAGLPMGRESDHVMMGTHLISGPGLSPGVG